MKKNAFDILYEDESIILVNKTSGVLVIPDRSQSPDNLKDYLESAGRKIFVVHRIDRDTSGIVLFAKTEAAHKALNKQFLQREVEKHYLALVEGVVREEYQEIDLPINTDTSVNGKVSINNKSGKSSKSACTVLETFKDCSLVKVQIFTGRLHQIRIHMQAIGHALKFDPIYGSEKGLFLSDYKPKYTASKGKEERPILNRLSLHAAELKFTHPSSGEELKFEADLHKDFSVVLKQLRKFSK